MAAASSKLYRFPPTRRLYADYDVVVPGAKKRGRHARELDEYLRQQEEDEVAGERENDASVSRDHQVIIHTLY